ncbi:MAG: Crp/Fnr family transcriptional regulator [Deltaproteobacteria bacterium]|nr:Crp/Fnr family transcriptional regulator [Deltaproteobacteria bacterium]
MTAETLAAQIALNPVFAAVSAVARQALVRGATLFEAAPDQIIFHAGAEAAHVYVLLDGVIRVFHEDKDGRQATVKHLTAPVTFAEMEVIAGCELLESTQALTAARLVRLDADRFRELVDREPAATALLFKDICARFCVAARNETAILCDVPTRLASQLLALADLFGKPTPAGIQIRKAINQGDLANGLGVVERSVRRTMTEWKKRGWISVHKGWLVLNRPEELEALCHGLRFNLNYGFKGAASRA